MVVDVIVVVVVVVASFFRGKRGDREREREIGNCQNSYGFAVEFDLFAFRTSG